MLLLIKFSKSYELRFDVYTYVVSIIEKLTNLENILTGVDEICNSLFYLSNIWF